MREAGWVPILMLFLLVFPSQVFDAFTRFPEIDIPMHLLGGVASGFFFHRLCINGSRFGVLGPYHAITHAVLVFSLVCTAAVFWEFAEFASDWFFGTHAQLSNRDTMIDLLLGASGGATFVSASAALHRWP